MMIGYLIMDVIVNCHDMWNVSTFGYLLGLFRVFKVIFKFFFLSFGERCHFIYKGEHKKWLSKKLICTTESLVIYELNALD